MHVIIPARYASTRLPGKPLLDIAGKPMIQHVYERARASGAQSVTVATDDARIRAACEKIGAPAVMTAGSHRSGTERLAEAIHTLGLGAEAIVVNLQGDEPLMPPTLIRRTADVLADRADAVVATVCCPIHDEHDLQNPNVVKVARDTRGYAMFFSRAPIPYARAGVRVPAYRHIGLYAYRAGYVAQYAQLAPSPYEQAEQLEQLRVLWHGGRIVLWETDQPPPAGVDSPEDLERVRRLLTS